MSQIVNVSSCEKIKVETDNLFGSLLERASRTAKGKVVYLPVDLGFGENGKKDAEVVQGYHAEVNE